MLLKNEGVQKLLATAQDWVDAQFYEQNNNLVLSESSWYFKNKLLHCEDKYWWLFILDIQDKVLSFLCCSKHWIFFDYSVKSYDGDNFLFSNHYLQAFFFLTLVFVFKFRTSYDKHFFPPPQSFSLPNLSYFIFFCSDNT